MGRVMISCPVTGTAISTGIEADRFSLEAAKAFQSRARCPACGNEHIWSRTDAWICESGPRAA